MKKLLVLFGIIVISGAAVALAMGDSTGNKEYSWRYKITVEIETPEGVKIGSSVRQVIIKRKEIGWSRINNSPHYVFNEKLTGEAVVIDLGERGVVFSLIQLGDYHDALNAFDIKTYQEVVDLPLGSKAKLTDKLPIFVTFKNMDDPKSVKGLNKQDLSRDLGQGVHLKSVTIKITEAPVTWGFVDEYLTKEFWKQYREWRKTMNIVERAKYIPTKYFRFKQGEK
jgi:hypothetical protein